jgi:DNA-binding XRE family transcriptional regulator
MPARLYFDIPEELVTQYTAGLLVLDEVAAQIGQKPATTLRTLQAKGVDTSMRSRKREQFARRVEAAKELPSGTAYATVATMYAAGQSLNEVAEKLDCASRTAWLILQRQHVRARPRWYREVFRDAQGNVLDRNAFAERLRLLRLSLGLKQSELAARCGLCQQEISLLERGIKSPRWVTLGKLTDGLGVSSADLRVTWQPLGAEI